MGFSRLDVSGIWGFGLVGGIYINLGCTIVFSVLFFCVFPLMLQCLEDGLNFGFFFCGLINVFSAEYIAMSEWLFFLFFLRNRYFVSREHLLYSYLLILVD